MKKIQCVHRWVINDDGDSHQIGTCQQCGKKRDFGLNPKVALDQQIRSIDLQNFPIYLFSEWQQMMAMLEGRTFYPPSLPVVLEDNAWYWPAVVPYDDWCEWT